MNEKLCPKHTTIPADNNGDTITEDCIAVVYFVNMWALSLLFLISLFNDALLFGLSKPLMTEREKMIVRIT